VGRHLGQCLGQNLGVNAVARRERGDIDLLRGLAELAADQRGDRVIGGQFRP
jgi:hypothetical protein